MLCRNVDIAVKKERGVKVLNVQKALMVNTTGSMSMSLPKNAQKKDVSASRKGKNAGKNK
jgi:hypothetical protein